MACQKVCKQGRDDIKLKVIYKALSRHLFYTTVSPSFCALVI